MKRILRALAIVIGGVIVVAVALYAIGLRVLIDGGGGLHLGFPASADERAAIIARHRESQRGTPPPAPVAPEPPAAPVAGEGAPPAADRPVVAEAPSAARPAYWTQFRGPSRNGVYDERPINTAWPAGGLKPLWKVPIGGGYASLSIAQGRAFTIEQRGKDEVVAAYDVRSGRELWISTWTATFRESMGGDGPRATPTWSAGRVYALGGTGELAALEEATGTVVWRTNILRDANASNLQWGMAASPLVVDGTVVVLPGGENGKSIVAYDANTGKIAWSALDDRQSYSSPMLVTLGGVTQILVFSASRVMGVVAKTGAVLWEFPWTTQYDVNASQPIVTPGSGSDRVFISTGYGAGAVMLDVTRTGERFGVRELWRTNRMKNQFTSSVYHDGFIYGLDEAILACIDAGTGELKWKGGRYGYGQVMLAGGHLIVVAENGELALVRATPERHVEVSRFPALEGKTWNHPALSDGILIVRNGEEMAAFDLRR